MKVSRVHEVTSSKWLEEKHWNFETESVFYWKCESFEFTFSLSL